MAAPLSAYSATTWENQQGYDPVQFVTNGDFSNGTTGWSVYQSGTTMSVSNGVMTITVGSSATTGKYRPMVTRTINTIPNGHKLYYSYSVKINATTPATANAVRTMFIYTSTVWCPSTQRPDTYFSDWTRITGLVTANSNKTRIYVGRYGSSSTYNMAVGDTVQVKNVMVIDLTATFGEGSEPTTVAEVQAYLPNEYYPTKTTGGSMHQIYCRLPLQLMEYTSDNTFKTTFYCDHILPVVDAAGHNCILGLVTPNSDNYNRHGSDRLGKLMIRWHNVDYNILNDGGLNTKPQAMLSSTLASTCVPMQFANYFKIAAHLKGAYYVDDNRFRADVYKVSGGVETYVDGGYFMPTAQQIDYPAQFAQNGVYTIVQPSVGISQGDTVRVKTTGINPEGEYTHTRVVEFTALAPVNFTQTYRFTSAPTSSTNPITGAKYLMAIDQSRYAANGTFTRLFALPSGDWLDLGSDQTEWLKGISGEEGAQTGNTNLSNLSNGYYYGVPTTWGGSTLRYVQIANGTSGSSTKRLAWFPNNYTTTNYNITIYLSGIHYTMTNTYTITVEAALSGTWSGNVNVSCPIYWIRRNVYTSAGITISGSGSSSRFTVGTFNITDSDVNTYDGIRTGDNSNITTSTTPAAANTTEGSMLMAQIQDDNI